MTDTLPGEYLPATYASVARVALETLHGVVDLADEGLDFDAVLEQAAKVLADTMWVLTQPETPALGFATTGELIAELVARGPFSSPAYTTVGPGELAKDVDQQVAGIALAIALEVADLVVHARVAQHPSANVTATYAALGVALLDRSTQA